jgi:hypothetical protein
MKVIEHARELEKMKIKELLKMATKEGPSFNNNGEALRNMELLQEGIG